MRLFMFLVVGALVLGSVYHTQVSRYLDQVFGVSGQSSSSVPILGAVGHVGGAANGLLTGAGKALHF